MKLHTCEHKGDQIFHTVYRGTYFTIVNFLYYPQHKTEGTPVLNVLPFILANELVINTVYFVMQTGMERATFGTWYPSQIIFTDFNNLHNKETMTEIIQGPNIIAEDLENDPEEIRTRKLTTFYASDLVNVYSRAQ